MKEYALVMDANGLLSLQTKDEYGYIFTVASGMPLEELLREAFHRTGEKVVIPLVTNGL